MSDEPSPTQEHLTLADSLAAFDKQVALCPLDDIKRRTGRWPEVCPRCSSTSDDGCGAWNAAAVRLERDVRMIAAAELALSTEALSPVTSGEAVAAHLAPGGTPSIPKGQDQ